MRENFVMIFSFAYAGVSCEQLPGCWVARKTTSEVSSAMFGLEAFGRVTYGRYCALGPLSSGRDDDGGQSEPTGREKKNNESARHFPDKFRPVNQW